jgi:hypothetical protein
MGDAEQMWITVVPALEDDEDDGAELVVVGIDPTSDDPGQQVVNVLLDRGHELREGVFYLLPFDLGLRYERGGDRLGVLVLTSPEVLDNMVPNYGAELAAATAPLRDAPLVDGGVVLLRRELATDFDPAATEGDQPVVLLIQDGPAAESDLFSAFTAGEAALAVIGPYSDGEDSDGR